MARRGKRPDEIREILLRDHEATLGRFAVSHRDDAGFKAGTATGVGAIAYGVGGASTLVESTANTKPR